MNSARPHEGSQPASRVASREGPGDQHGAQVMTVGLSRPVNSCSLLTSSAVPMMLFSTSWASFSKADSSAVYASMYRRMVAPAEPVPLQGAGRGRGALAGPGGTRLGQGAHARTRVAGWAAGVAVRTLPAGARGRPRAHLRRKMMREPSWKTKRMPWFLATLPSMGSV